MFRSSTIIREPALKLAKAIFMLKRSVKLRRYLLCGCMAACHGMACVLHAVQNATDSAAGFCGTSDYTAPYPKRQQSSYSKL
jgi:hypothetical protein